MNSTSAADASTHAVSPLLIGFIGPPPESTRSSPTRQAIIRHTSDSSAGEHIQVQSRMARPDRARRRRAAYWSLARSTRARSTVAFAIPHASWSGARSGSPRSPSVRGTRSVACRRATPARRRRHARRAGRRPLRGPRSAPGRRCARSRAASRLLPQDRSRTAPAASLATRAVASRPASSAVALGVGTRRREPATPRVEDVRHLPLAPNPGSSRSTPRRSRSLASASRSAAGSAAVLRLALAGDSSLEDVAFHGLTVQPSPSRYAIAASRCSGSP